MSTFYNIEAENKIQTTHLPKQITIGDNECLIRVKTLNGHTLYLKYKQGSKTFSDIKNVIFDKVKYACNGLADKNKFTFEFNDISIKDITTNKNDSLIEDSLEGSSLLDTLAKSNIELKLIIDKEKINSEKKLQLGFGLLPTTKEITESMKKFGEQFDTEICVKTLTGGTVVFKCDKTVTTINDLKIGLYNKEGISLNQQRIIYAGKQLEDQYFISDYIGKQKSAIMHLVLRLRGGMFNEVSGRNGIYEPLTDLYYDLDEEINISNNTELRKKELIKMYKEIFLHDLPEDLVDDLLLDDILLDYINRSMIENEMSCIMSSLDDKIESIESKLKNMSNSDETSNDETPNDDTNSDEPTKKIKSRSKSTEI
jgi:hypothetical protein